MQSLAEVGVNWFSELLDPSGIGAIFRQLGAEIHHPQFWVSLSKIIWINVLLSGTTRWSLHWRAAPWSRASGFGA
jgi:hypothetical protein